MRRAMLACSLVLVLAGHALQAWTLPGLQRLEWWLYDARIAWWATPVAEDQADERLTIVDIDEASLREPEQGGEGRWPWPRERLAALVQGLFEQQGAAVVGLDIILAGRHPGDATLAKAMRMGPVVVGDAFHTGGGSSGAPPPGLDTSGWPSLQVRIRSYEHAIGVVPDLRQAAAGSGHVQALRDADGVTRRVPMLIEQAQRWHPSLSLSVLRALSDAPAPMPVWASYGDRNRIEALEVAGLRVPVDEALQALVPYRRGSATVPVVSAAEVSQGRLAPGSLQGRIVLVGSSASGLADLVTTPLHASLPGVHVHAELIAGFLDGRVAREPAYARMAEVVLVLLALPLAWWGGRWRPLTLVAAAGCCAVLLVVGQGALLAHHGLLLPLAAPLLAVFLPTALQVAWGYAVESRSRRQMATLFASYVPPEIVQRLAENPGAYSMKPLERELTVLFADVRGFTTVSESLSPQALADWINEYLTAMSLVIREQHHGTLDKYIGDAVMAFWGAPLEDAAHAERAVCAALAMQRTARELSAAFVAKGWPPVAIGVGVNSGLMRVGDMGSQLRRAYTVMGDAVNLGSRLEGLTRAYGVDVLIGQDTRERLPHWVCREVDRVRVKGKQVPVRIYEPLGPKEQVSEQQQALVAQWDQMLSLVHHRNWSAALSALDRLGHEDPGQALVALYRQRVQHLMQHPPGPDWDGVTHFDAK
ncbi:MAG: adenylate/guanylate cyclase domain-containing protein [Betaproteobacteria bacterium]|nr:adenylate/guanylate cyclase domain-containing protein [Betaproteobacteria bacterium]